SPPRFARTLEPLANRFIPSPSLESTPLPSVEEREGPCPSPVSRSSAMTRDALWFLILREALARGAPSRRGDRRGCAASRRLRRESKLRGTEVESRRGSPAPSPPTAASHT